MSINSTLFFSNATPKRLVRGRILKGSFKTMTIIYNLKDMCSLSNNFNINLSVFDTSDKKIKYDYLILSEHNKIILPFKWDVLITLSLK